MAGHLFGVMHGRGGAEKVRWMPEGLSAAEVGKEIAEHRDHAEHREDAAHAEHAAADHTARDRLISILEALLLSIVALMAAWSGYAAAKWSTESSLSLSKASAARSGASANQIQATQVRTLDSGVVQRSGVPKSGGDDARLRR